MIVIFVCSPKKCLWLCLSKHKKVWKSVDEVFLRRGREGFTRPLGGDLPGRTPGAAARRAHEVAEARRLRWAEVERDSPWWRATGGRPPRWPRGLRRGPERVVAPREQQLLPVERAI